MGRSPGRRKCCQMRTTLLAQRRRARRSSFRSVNCCAGAAWRHRVRAGSANANGMGPIKSTSCGRTCGAWRLDWRQRSTRQCVAPLWTGARCASRWWSSQTRRAAPAAKRKAAGTWCSAGSHRTARRRRPQQGCRRCRCASQATRLIGGRLNGQWPPATSPVAPLTFSTTVGKILCRCSWSGTRISTRATRPRRLRSGGRSAALSNQIGSATCRWRR